MIELVIFDMDGLLIDTEPYWQQTERDVFRKYGIEIDPEMQKATFGLRSDEQIEHWLKVHPVPGVDVKTIEDDYFNVIHEYFLHEAELMPGAEYILEFFKGKDLPLALASSSPMFLIKSFVERFNFDRYFSVLHSAENEEFGKPHPAVYITTARKLMKNPLYCLAFEDSYNGLLAAKAARMKAVVVPDHRTHDNGKYDIADLVLESLHEYGEKEFQLFV
jgi:mannitol-1-/sugar-/sorbitol-6-/2-deoxyglucose-6-phosphatase